MLTGWQFYKLHQALNLHFHDLRYDVFKYFGKINSNPEKYGIKDDRYRYEYYAGKFYNNKKALQFCVANFIRGNKDFVHYSYEDAESEYLQWRKIQDSITQTFQNDLSKIKEHAGSANIFIPTPNGNQPPLLQMMKVGYITLETAVILNNEVGKSFFDMWTKLCDDDPYAKNLILKCKKYTPFVKYNKDKIKSLVKDFLS